MEILLETATITHEIKTNTHFRKLMSTSRLLFFDVLYSLECVVDLPQAKRASYDAKSLVDCYVTGAKILDDLLLWAFDDGGTYIYWLNGMARTGKTTIASTFSKMLNDPGMLGASFFCSHIDTDLSSAQLIFPTLAYHMPPMN
jgi:hypothetical protein